MSRGTAWFEIIFPAPLVPCSALFCGSRRCRRELLIHAGTVGAPALLLAGPALELVDRWTAELQVLSRRSLVQTSLGPCRPASATWRRSSDAQRNRCAEWPARAFISLAAGRGHSGVPA